MPTKMCTRLVQIHDSKYECINQDTYIHTYIYIYIYIFIINGLKTPCPNYWISYIFQTHGVLLPVLAPIVGSKTCGRRLGTFACHQRHTRNCTQCLYLVNPQMCSCDQCLRKNREIMKCCVLFVAPCLFACMHIIRSS